MLLEYHGHDKIRVLQLKICSVEPNISEADGTMLDNVGYTNYISSNIYPKYDIHLDNVGHTPYVLQIPSQEVHEPQKKQVQSRKGFGT